MNLMESVGKNIFFTINWMVYGYGNLTGKNSERNPCEKFGPVTHSTISTGFFRETVSPDRLSLPFPLTENENSLELMLNRTKSPQLVEEIGKVFKSLVGVKVC